jgi:predicted amidohydrolase YtcJ
MRTLFQNFRWGLDGQMQQMLVDDGRVIDRSPNLDQVEGAAVENLGGHYLLPAFVESHCHVLPAGLDLLKLHLGSASSHEEVLDLVRKRHDEQPESWLMAVHYDQNRYGGVHLDRQALDAISPDRPIFLSHSNGHAGVANSAALRAAGVNEQTPDPEGGEYVRDASGRMTGVLLETAYEHVRRSPPKPTLDEMVQAVVRIGKVMRHEGIGCATDMMTGAFDLEMEMEAYRRAIDEGCPISIRLFVQWRDVFGKKGIGAERLREYGIVGSSGGDARLRVCGVKIFADGAIASGTAAIYGRFANPNSGGPVISRSAKPASASSDREVDGQLIYSPEKLNEMVLIASDAGFTVSTHSIGDYSTDLVMNAYDLTGDAKRHRIEHAMILSDSQIERMADLGCHCALQPEFLLRLGHAYKRQLGEERAARLIRSRSILDAGIPTSFSSDRPIVAGNPWDGIATASCRPAGFDPAENCTRAEAIIAYTAGGAVANGEPTEMGTLLPGSLADYQVLETDPLAAP